MSPSPAPLILIVEDEPDIGNLIEFHFQKEGFRTARASNGALALELAKVERPDLIILDLMIPRIDGMSVFQELRRKTKTREIPVIMLTAKAQPDDRIAGLEAGADDYLIKPFSPKELILRAKAQLRVKQRTKEGHIFRIAGLEFDKSAARFSTEEGPVDLTTTEFKLLLHLCEHANEVQKRTVLLQKIWGYSDQVYSRTLDTHVKRLRNKIGPASQYIKTIRGVGYLFVQEEG